LRPTRRVRSLRLRMRPWTRCAKDDALITGFVPRNQ
jgi:hypothetical protein